MFGTILFIPLFVQGVIGTNATDSGKVLWPMMFGMLTSSISTGQIIQRTGKYKVFGVVGLLIVAGGLFLCSMMTVDTGYWTAARNMVVLGAGMGMTFPVFSLAVQNAVPYRVMGIAMSSLQFFRTLGGMMGTAIFGAIMTNGFQPEFKRLAEPALAQITRTARSVPPQVLTQLPPQAQKALQNPGAMFDNPQILLSPEAMAQLRMNFARFPGGDALLDQLLQAVRSALAGSLHNVFFIGTFVLLSGFVVALFLGERPLRKSNVPEAAEHDRPSGAVDWSPAVAAEQAPLPPTTRTPAEEPAPRATRDREPVPVAGD
jgi:MFS family permease